jgi:hypothetical protein
LTLGVGQILLGVISSRWAKLAIALVFVAPAIVAGYHSTHGIAKHMMPSETWQIVLSVIGAIAFGVTAYLGVAGMAAADQSGRDMVQAKIRASDAGGPDRRRRGLLIIGGWSNLAVCQGSSSGHPGTASFGLDSVRSMLQGRSDQSGAGRQRGRWPA